jgi:hypothetical protein
MARRFTSFAVLLCLVTAGCASGPRPAPAVGEAFIGPATLVIREEIGPRSDTVATLRHGDKVQIIGTRRSFVKVRTSSAAEGWTHERSLLTAREMDALRQLAIESGRMPPQGVATVFDLLNVHIEPARWSPSFVQIQQDERVEVLEHRVELRDSRPVRRQLLARVASPEPKPAPEPMDALALPMPAAPALPPHWLRLSVAEQPAVAEDLPKDDWTLIRNKSGQAGWVLTSRLFMDVPDEVAQYAERRRIMAYFRMGEVRDGELRKQNWMWATVERRNQLHDFDSVRIFVWSARRHRYETGFIVRNLTGYYPILLEKTGEGVVNGFSFPTLTRHGERVRRYYSFTATSARFLHDLPEREAGRGEPALLADGDFSEPEPARPDIFERFRARFGGLPGR